MTDTQTFDCPKCHAPIDYPSTLEGRTGVCPSCNEQVWYSKLAHPDGENPTGTKHSSPFQFQGTDTKKSLWQQCVVALVVLLFAIEGFRLRGELQQIRHKLESDVPSQSSAQHRSQPHSASALAHAQMNQAHLEAVVTEINAIEAVIEKKLNQLTQRSNSDSERLARFASTLDSTASEIEELQFSITEIQATLESLIESHNQLEIELNTR